MGVWKILIFCLHTVGDSTLESGADGKMFYHNIKEDLRSPRKIPPASRFRFSLIFTMSLLTCFPGFTWQTKYDINCGLASNNGNEHPEHLKDGRRHHHNYWFPAFAFPLWTLWGCTICLLIRTFTTILDTIWSTLFYRTRKEDVCGRKNIALLRIVRRLCSADINLDKNFFLL